MPPESPENPYVTVRLIADGVVTNPSVTLSGNNVGYKVSPPDLPGCVKIWQGSRTLIYPLARVVEIEVNL